VSAAIRLFAPSVANAPTEDNRPKAASPASIPFGSSTRARPHQATQNPCVQPEQNQYGSWGLRNGCGAPMEVWWSNGTWRIGAGAWFPTSGKPTGIFVCNVGYRYNSMLGQCDG
jgi:hypothetical protein